MRRIQLIVALFGTIGISTAAFGAGGHGGSGSHGNGGHGGKGGNAGHGSHSGHGAHGTTGLRGGNHGHFGHARLGGFFSRPLYNRGGIVIPVVGAGYADPMPIAEVPGAEWGMKLTDLSPGSPAAKANLRVGDIIMVAGGVRTESFEDLAAALAAADGPMELEIINGENNRRERMQITPANGKIGATTLAAVVE